MTRLEHIHENRAARYMALAALAVPVLLTAIDIAVAGVALPSIARALSPTAGQLLWIVDSYNYLLAGSMLTMAAVADRFGRRRVLLICATVFALASAVAAFSPTATMLIVARGIMGIAGSACLPVAMSIIGAMFVESRARLQAMGAFLTVFLVGMMIAPFVGGLLLASFWWGSVFLIGVPVMIVAVIALPLFVPEVRAETPGPIDLPSTALSIAGVLLLVASLKTAVDRGITVEGAAELVIGVVLVLVFVRRQRRLDHPLVDLQVFTEKPVVRALAAMFTTSLLMGGSSLFFTLYVQEVQGLTPLEAAVWMAPQMASMIVAANLGPWLVRRFSRDRVVLVMLGVATAGFAAYAVLPSGIGGLYLVVLGGALTTFGIGAAYPLLMDRVIGGAPPQRAAATAAIAQLSNELGIAAGLTVLGALGTWAFRVFLPVGSAGNGIVDAIERATVAADPHDADAARVAFTQTFDLIGIVAVVLMLCTIALVFAGRAAPAARAVQPATTS